MDKGSKDRLSKNWEREDYKEALKEIGAPLKIESTEKGMSKEKAERINSMVLDGMIAIQQRNEK